MNYEEKLKQGLEELPGGEWREDRITQVIQAAKVRKQTSSDVSDTRQGKHRSGTGTRRTRGVHGKRPCWLALAPTATAGAAAVVLATAVIGVIVMHEKKTTTDTSLITNAGSLQLYDAGRIYAQKPIAWPGLPTNADPYSTKLPVVRVNTVYGVTMSTVLTPPTTIAASVPPRLASQLCAYFVQMDANTSFYVIGPRGLKGKAEMATDGSFGLYLHNQDAMVELDTPGGSPIVAARMASPFFQAARDASQSYGFGTSRALSDADIVRPNAKTAYFSFQAKDGKNVAGMSYFLMKPQAESALMVYAAKGHDWSFAPYVVQSGSNLMNNILAPQLSGKPVKQSDKVELQGTTVSLPHGRGEAVHTPSGIAWIWQPTFIEKIQPMAPTSSVPSGPYFIAFAKPKDGKVDRNAVQLRQMIPFVKAVDGDNDVYYAFPSGLSVTANRWVWYYVAWSAVDMNQSVSYDLHVYDVKTGQDTIITPFHMLGGMFFAVGTSGQYLAYDQSGIIDGQGDIGHEVWLVNLATGEKQQLPSGDFTTSGMDDVVRTTIAGKRLVIHLKQMG